MMSDFDAFRDALRAALRSDAGPTTRAVAVAEIGAAALPGDGAAITLMMSDQQRQTLAATDSVIADIERFQFTVGEGPSMDAVTRGRPVLVPDLSTSYSWSMWPGLSEQLAGAKVRAVFAFPMRFGAAVIGAALCYRRTPGELDRAEVGLALRVLDLVTLALIRLRGIDLEGEAQDEHDVDDGWIDGNGLLGARVIHQATGMVMVQLGGVASTIAFARLRAYAFANDQTLEDVAAEIVGRRLILEADSGPGT